MRVLLVRFSAIGDCVMTAWAASALRHQHPEATLAWAVESRCVPVIDTTSLVNDLCIFPRERWKKRRGDPRVFGEQIRTYLGLRRYKFDLALDFQGHSKTALATRLCGASRRLSARATDALARRLNPVLNPSLQPGEHEIELYGRMLPAAGFGPVPEFPIMPPLPALPTPISAPFVSIQTGAGELDKRVPVEHWEAVAADLVHRGIPVVALGGPQDPPLDGPGIVNGVGQWSLLESMAVIKASAVHLAGDTGSGHIAAALNVPVVSIFGRTDPARFRPWTARGTVLRGGNTPGETSVTDILEAAQTWWSLARTDA